MTRPAATALAAALLLAGGLASAAPRVTAERAAAVAPTGGPPHAWLFGTWSGGLFPAPDGMSRAQCLSQPVMIFTRDLVLRAVVTDQLLEQHVIETARATATGTDFRFSAAAAPAAASGVLGLDGTPAAGGFSCENPDVLHVQRVSEQSIVLPGCADFAYPLVRC